MHVLSTLGPLLLALLIGYWLDVKPLTAKRVATSLNGLTYIILGLIGFSIGALDNLSDKLYTAGSQAMVFFILLSVLSLTALYFTGKYLNPKDKSQHPEAHVDEKKLGWGVLSEAGQTLAWVIIGAVVGYFGADYISHIDEIVTWLLYLLLFLIGCQLRQGNYRLRKLFLNHQGVIIASATVLSTLAAGLIGAMLIGLPWQQGLAVVSGFGWYSLSGILITGLGDPVLGTTAFLLDLSREILALMLIPIFAKVNSHLSVGYSGATAMDFTLPMLGKFHGADIVPVAIASGFIMSLLVPILIPLFMGL